MRAIGRRVLVEIITTKKQRHIIVGDKQAPEDEFTTTYKILQMGPDCPTDEVKVGDIPIFEAHGVFVGSKTIKEVKNVELTRHAIIAYDEIAGIDN